MTIDLKTIKHISKLSRISVDDAKADKLAGAKVLGKIDLDKKGNPVAPKPVAKPAPEVKAPEVVVEAPEVVEEKQPEAEVQEEQKEEPVLEEIIEDEKDNTNEEGLDGGTKVADTAPEPKEVLQEEKTQEPEVNLPEGIQDLVKFMEETGGSIEDFSRLNADYSNVDENTLLREYYKQTKPHLDNEEINFLMEDTFSYDEDVDEDRDIRRKKLALKEQVASAKSHLDGQKSKYYEEVKAGSRLTTEQQKAVNFFNRYNKESEETNKIAEKQTNTFKLKTKEVFNDKFKGFEYNVGDKRYRFNVKNANEVKETQGDINNFVKKFLNENNEMSDAKGYHKSLFTAMNPDAIANHFYEQGKADAMKDSVAKAKNVSMDPRQSFSNDNTSGPKVRVLNDDTSPTFKFKIKNK